VTKLNAAIAALLVGGIYMPQSLAHDVGAFNASGPCTDNALTANALTAPVGYGQTHPLLINNPQATQLEKNDRARGRTTDAYLLLSAENLDKNSNAEVTYVYGSQHRRKDIGDEAGYGLNIPLTVTNFRGYLLSVYNSSIRGQADIGVRLNGQTCSDGEFLPNGEERTLSAGSVAYNCHSPNNERELIAETRGNKVSLFAVYGAQYASSGRPYLVAFNCQAENQAKCVYLSNWAIDMASPDKFLRIPIKRFHMVTVINLSAGEELNLTLREYSPKKSK